MNLQSDDFELMGLPRQFALDRAVLDERWKELQKQTHPDRFAGEGGVAQRVAMQWSVRINEAYQRLKHPLKRAAYLCELFGVPVRAEDNTAMPAAFLMQQMEWREALEEGQSDSVRSEVLAEHEQALAQLSEHSAAHNWNGVAQTLAKYQFIENFLAQLNMKQ